MRITAKISADGNRWAVKFPTVDATKCFPFLGGKKTAQPDECLAELQRLERKIVAERVAYARADWACRWDAKGKPRLVCTITTNDNGAFQRNPFYRMWAWKMAEAAKSMSDDFEDGGENGIGLRGECAQLLKELDEFKAEKRREDELKRVNEQRFMCERHMVGGACSPAKFDCPCYKGGMCVEAKA